MSLQVYLKYVCTRYANKVDEAAQTEKHSHGKHLWLPMFLFAFWKQNQKYSKEALTHNCSKEWFWGFGKNGRGTS